jgi:hypothetical protein
LNPKLHIFMAKFYPITHFSDTYEFLRRFCMACGKTNSRRLRWKIVLDAIIFLQSKKSKVIPPSVVDYEMLETVVHSENPYATEVKRN